MNEMNSFVATRLKYIEEFDVEGNFDDALKILDAKIKRDTKEALNETPIEEELLDRLPVSRGKRIKDALGKAVKHTAIFTYEAAKEWFSDGYQETQYPHFNDLQKWVVGSGVNFTRYPETYSTQIMKIVGPALVTFIGGKDYLIMGRVDDWFVSSVREAMNYRVEGLSDDEMLCFVLAHELAHIDQRKEGKIDNAKQMKTLYLVGAVCTVGKFIAKKFKVDDAIISWFTNKAYTAFMPHEEEADREANRYITGLRESVSK